MSAQNDIIAGLDPSSLASITQAQLLQMINQAAPLSNIGLLVFQAGTSLSATIAQGTGGSPSVTDNPRFARYIWLNTYAATYPTPYYYNSATGDWTATTVAALSIANAQIATNAAIEVTKLAAGTAYYLIRTNAAGTAVEFVSPASIFASIKCPISGIEPNASDGFLKTASGVMAWSTNATERAAFQAAIANLAVSQLQPGSNGNLLYVTAGVPTWGAPATVLGAGSNIPSSALAQSGASNGNLLYWDGSAWSPLTQALTIVTNSTISTTGVTASQDASGAAIDGDFDNGTFRIAHGFGAKPKLYKVVAILAGADAASGYALNDEIAIESFVASVGGEVSQLFCVYADSSYIYGLMRTVTLGNVFIQAKGASAAARVNPTALSNFKFRAYAYK